MPLHLILWIRSFEGQKGGAGCKQLECLCLSRRSLRQRGGGEHGKGFVWNSKQPRFGQDDGEASAFGSGDRTAEQAEIAAAAGARQTLKQEALVEGRVSAKPEAELENNKSELRTAITIKEVEKQRGATGKAKIELQSQKGGNIQDPEQTREPKNAEESSVKNTPECERAEKTKTRHQLEIQKVEKSQLTDELEHERAEKLKGELN